VHDVWAVQRRDPLVLAGIWGQAGVAHLVHPQQPALLSILSLSPTSQYFLSLLSLYNPAALSCPRFRGQAGGCLTWCTMSGR